MRFAAVFCSSCWLSPRPPALRSPASSRRRFRRARWGRGSTRSRGRLCARTRTAASASRSIRSWRRIPGRTSTTTPTSPIPTTARARSATTSRRSALFVRECASVTFDRRGRIVTVCVGLDRPGADRARPPDPPPVLGAAAATAPDRHGQSLHELRWRRLLLPRPSRPRRGAHGRATDRDRPGQPCRRARAAAPARPDRRRRPGRRDHRGDARLARADLVRLDGRGGGLRDPVRLGQLARHREPIGNSFAVGEDGGVYIVTDAALYRFQARRGYVRTAWRAPYPNVGVVKPGRTQAGSGTTPTLLGRRYVAITTTPTRWRSSCAGATPRAGGSCREPVFERGTGATDQSLIGAGRSLVVENNFGYTGIASTLNGATTTPGSARGHRPRRALSLVASAARARLPRSSRALPGRGLVYTYEARAGRPPRRLVPDRARLRNGKTRWRSRRHRGGVQQQLRAGLDRAGPSYVGVLGGSSASPRLIRGSRRIAVMPKVRGPALRGSDTSARLASAQARIAELETEIARLSARDALVPSLLTLPAFRTQLSSTSSAPTAIRGRSRSRSWTSIASAASTWRTATAPAAPPDRRGELLASSTRAYDLVCRSGGDETSCSSPRPRPTRRWPSSSGSSSS